MLAGGYNDSGIRVSDRHVMATIDLNRDGIPDEVVTGKMRDGEELVWAELKTEGGNSTQLGACETVNPHPSPGIFRFCLDRSLHRAGLPTYSLNKTPYFIGDVVRLPYGDIGIIDKVAYDVKAPGLAMGAFVYYTSDIAVRYLHLDEAMDPNPISLDEVQKLFSWADWEREVDDLIACVKKELPKEIEEREELIKYAKRDDLKQPYRDRVFAAEGKIFKKMRELAEQRVFPEVADCLVASAMKKFGIHPDPTSVDLAVVLP